MRVCHPHLSLPSVASLQSYLPVDHDPTPFVNTTCTNRLNADTHTTKSFFLTVCTTSSARLLYGPPHSSSCYDDTTWQPTVPRLSSYIPSFLQGASTHAVALAPLLSFTTVCLCAHCQYPQSLSSSLAISSSSAPPLSSLLYLDLGGDQGGLFLHQGGGYYLSFL